MDPKTRNRPIFGTTVVTRRSPSEDSDVPLGFLSLTKNVMVAMAIWMIAAPAALSMAH